MRNIFIAEFLARLGHFHITLHEYPTKDSEDLELRQDLESQVAVVAL